MEEGSPSKSRVTSKARRLRHHTMVFRAFEETGTSYGRVAACKVVDLFISPAAGVSGPNHKELQKEVQVHKSLKHEYILEFIANELVEEQSGYIPGLYMLLELAIGGDLFDKIGELPSLAL